MKLIADWRDVLLKAWSVRFIVMAALFEAVSMFMDLLETGDPIIDVILRGLSATSIAAAGVARILSQKNLSEEEKADVPVQEQNNG